MARLTTKARDSIPAGEFAGPDRSYPIPDASHARNALARASQNAGPDLKAKIREKVHRKFPDIQIEGDKAGHRMDRPSRRK